MANKEDGATRPVGPAWVRARNGDGERELGREAQGARRRPAHCHRQEVVEARGQGTEEANLVRAKVKEKPRPGRLRLSIRTGPTDHAWVLDQVRIRVAVRVRLSAQWRSGRSLDQGHQARATNARLLNDAGVLCSSRYGSRAGESRWRAAAEVCSVSRRAALLHHLALCCRPRLQSPHSTSAPLVASSLVSPPFAPPPSASFLEERNDRCRLRCRLLRRRPHPRSQAVLVPRPT